jgi:hypothetical protein
MRMHQSGYAMKPVGAGEHQDLTQLELDYLATQTQLGNFAISRDASRGRADAEALHRLLRARREQIVRRLESLEPAGPQRVVPLSTAAIKAASIRQGLTPWFGYSGTVQCGAAEEGRHSDAAGVKGKLETASLEPNGAIFFKGELAGEPIEGHENNEGTYDPSHAQVWLRVWKYLIPFPPPPVDSIFTCSFRVEVQFRADACIPPVSLFSKVRTYGIPDFTGSQVGSNGETLWLVDGVTLPAGPARVTRDGTAHRSFKVRAGRSPAIVMHTTIALGLLEPMSDLVLNPVASYFIPAPGTIEYGGTHAFHENAGLISFHYEPDIVLHQ